MFKHRRDAPLDRVHPETTGRVVMDPAQMVTALQQLLSPQRFVDRVKGLQTPHLWRRIQQLAVDKDRDWETFVSQLSHHTALATIQWCEQFLRDLITIHRHTQHFSKAMEKRGVDSSVLLGSADHEETKLRLLLTEGEAAVFHMDLKEDLIFRSVNRLETLVYWAHQGAARLHHELVLCQEIHDKAIEDEMLGMLVNPDAPETPV